MDRRKAERLSLVKYLRVYDRQSDVFLGHMVDVSESGLQLVSEKPLPSWKFIRLGVEIVSDRLEVDGRTAWCQEDTYLDSYHIGIKILAKKPSSNKKLKCLLRVLRSNRQN